ncbi:MAG TPA: hypothetical protein PLW44_03550 [Chitinophagales bacterium]|nr:hypothetical protein [Chitinophagales bacterium]
MRTISLVIICLSLLSGTITAQNVADLEAFEKAIKPGTQLIYDVTETNGKRYPVVVTLTSVGPEVAYEWKATGAEPKTGTVSMSADAVAKAEALHIGFTSGDVKTDAETGLIISQKVFKDVATTSTANVKVKGKDDTPTLLNNVIGEYNFNLNGALVAIPGWELEGGVENAYSIQVLESAKFPLIFQLNAGWRIQLVEVKVP